MSTDPLPNPPPSLRDYTLVFAALMVLLVLTTASAFVDFSHFLPGSHWGISIALSIAIAKALLILFFFMHLKSGSRRAVVFAAAGFLWLGILLTLTLTDYLTRNNPPHASPKGEPRYLATP